MNTIKDSVSLTIFNGEEWIRYSAYKELNQEVLDLTELCGLAADALESPEEWEDSEIRILISKLKSWSETPVLHLNKEDSLFFAEMLLNPPEPNEALRKLMQNEEGEK